MKKILGITMAILMMLVAVACGKSEEPKELKAEVEKVTFTHELGETTVEKNPKKVVIFDLAALDTLDNLGVEVTGVPKDSLPEYLSKYKEDKYENVGGLKEPDFEKISEIGPDLIIISGRQAESYEEFQKIAPTLYLGTDYTDYLASVKKNTEVLGEIFGKETEVTKALETIDEEVKALHENTSTIDEKALVVLANDGKISAYGPNSRFGIIHEEFGVKPIDPNIEASTHGQSISFEYIAEKNPDYIYVIDRSAVVGGSSSAKQVIENAIVKETNAYKNNRIIYLNADYWYSVGGGLTSISEMVNEITKSLQ